jgi:16S rRNA (cytidine1402-2'-O)-methyltransferase
MKMKNGTLYLIPSPLGDTLAELVMPSKAIYLLHQLNFLIVEDLRTARRLLSKTKIDKPIDSITFFELNKFTVDADAVRFLKPITEGNDAGLLSEAGSPCVADPGAVIVRAAHQAGINVVPLSGPSSIIMALMASGFNGQSFCFHGYLPIHPDLRNKHLKSIEKTATNTGQTQIFIETPFRNNQILEAVFNNCSPSTMLCIAANISLSDEFIASKNIGEWQKQRPDIHKKPTVFLIWNEKRP